MNNLVASCFKNNLIWQVGSRCVDPEPNLHTAVFFQLCPYILKFTLRCVMCPNFEPLSLKLGLFNDVQSD